MATGAKKRLSASSSSNASDSDYTYEREYQTLSWLRCKVDESPSLVDTLTCSVCQKFEDNIQGLKNFSAAWITGSSNHRASNIVDHGKSEQHKTAMKLEKIERAKANKQSVSSYSALARSFQQIDEATRDKLRKKFDIAYVLAKEHMAFKKYPVIYALESRHGIELGHAYRTKDSAKSFTHYIAQAQRQDFTECLSLLNYVSFLMDGTTDAGRVEDELIIIVYCLKDENVKEIRSCTRIISVEAPKKVEATGLIKCLENGLQVIGMEGGCLHDSVKMLANAGKPILIGWGLCEYFQPKWNAWNLAKISALALLELVLCPPSGTCMS